MENLRIEKSSLDQIKKISKDREIVLFGAGGIASKTYDLLKNFKISCILDYSENLWETKELNLKIKKPSELLKKNKNKFFIIITTTSYRQVIEQLKKFNLTYNKDVLISPILNDILIMNELESLEKEIIFSSGTPPNYNQKFGGGIYKVEIDRDRWTYEKKIDGHSFGLIEFEGNYVCVDNHIGIFEFNKNFKILRKKKLPAGIRGHGISYSKKYKRFFVPCSYLDSILVLNKDFKIVDEIKFSLKTKKSEGPAYHHLNDCLTINDSLYVSMFSITGNYKLDVYDGGVVEIDITSKKRIGTMISNLWMPHNIQLIDNSIHVLDSFPGYLRTNNNQIIGEFNAFTRGLDFDGKFYYVGQSKNRNHSKTLGTSNNISIDCGISVFDKQTKVSRFIQFSPKISEIHSVKTI